MELKDCNVMQLIKKLRNGVDELLKVAKAIIEKAENGDVEAVNYLNNLNKSFKDRKEN